MKEQQNLEWKESWRDGYLRWNCGFANAQVNGPLLLQLNKTIEVLQVKYLKALICYEGLQRVERWPMPMAALREAVLNAMVYRDYPSGAPIQISVYSRKPVETPVEMPVEAPVETREKILAALKTRPDLTLAELPPAIGKSRRAVERATARLVREEKLRFVGPKKGRALGGA
ncbi:MAG: hypothetical protein V5B32_03900 [Candidatus Accumulibacter sp. UW26]|jgi:predicted HTH transcriptional regulator